MSFAVNSSNMVAAGGSCPCGTSTISSSKDDPPLGKKLTSVHFVVSSPSMQRDATCPGYGASPRGLIADESCRTETPSSPQSLTSASCSPSWSLMRERSLISVKLKKYVANLLEGEVVSEPVCSARAAIDDACIILMNANHGKHRRNVPGMREVSPRFTLLARLVRLARARYAAAARQLTSANSFPSTRELRWPIGVAGFVV